MKRREFITILGGAAAVWPLATRAQQRAIPTVGFFRSGQAKGSTPLQAAFVRGLKDAGFVEGQNVSIEYRWTDDRLDQLPALASELIGRGVAVIVANQPAALAAKAVTSTVPVVFVSGADPVSAGLVASMNRPGGNVTGIVFTVGDLTAKRLGLLHELVPHASVMGVLVDPHAPALMQLLKGVEEAGRALGVRLEIAQPASAQELETTFPTIVSARAGGLLVGGGGFFLGQMERIVALATRHRLPATYTTRSWPEAGGLMSYGPSQLDAYHRAGLYVARILKGDKPADLPVDQATKFELVINLKTAKALGVAVPTSMQLLADEVIE
jgi:putative tryptophan/tyrosine transport system substrate-binding protein